MNYRMISLKQSQPFAYFSGWAVSVLAQYFAGLLVWMKSHKFSVAIVVLAASSALVMAQGELQLPGWDPGAASSPEIPSRPSVSGYQFNAVQMAGQIAIMAQTALDSLAANTSLQSWGQTLMAFFVVSLMTWGLLKNLASGKGMGEWIGDLVPIFVSFGIAYLLINNAGAQAIESTMTSLGSAIGGGNWSTLSNAIQAVATPVFKGIAAILHMPRIQEQADSGIAAMLAYIPSVLMTSILKLVTVILLVLAAVGLIATTFMTFTSVKLALIFAPVMVPFLMFKPMSWVFDSWLRFLLGACMMKIVGAFMLRVAVTLLSGMNSLGEQIAREAAGISVLDAMQADILLHGMMMVFGLLASLLMIQAPGIATGLLQGSAGSTGFSGIKGITQSAGARVTSAGLNAGGKAGLKVAGAGVAGMVGGGVGAFRAWQGHKHASSLTQGSNKADTLKGFQKWAYDKSYTRTANKVHGPLKSKGFIA